MENEVVTITKLPLKQRQLYKNINRDKNKQKHIVVNFRKSEVSNFYYKNNFNSKLKWKITSLNKIEK